MENVENGKCSAKRVKRPMFQNVDKAVVDSFTAARNKNMPISGGLLKEKAMASTGWLDKWKQRHYVSCRKSCGETNDVRAEDCDKWKTDILPYLLENYNERDICYADETGFFFKCLPDKTMALKNEQCHGGKNSKQRVTLVLAANMDASEKLKILLIGKSNIPCCFHGVKSFSIDNKDSSKARVTRALLEEWILKLDKQLLRAGRKIVLLVDNCPAHQKDLKNKLKGIEFAFFSPNMTFKLQPLDQGIIQSLIVSNRILKETLKRIESKAWDIDVKNQTIAKCFKKAGLGQNSSWDEEDDIPLIFWPDIDENRNLLEADYETWLRVNEIISNAALQDYIEVDNEVITSQFPTDDDIIEHYNSKLVDPTLGEAKSNESSVEDIFVSPPRTM